MRDHLQRSCYVAGSAGPGGAGATETAARVATAEVNQAMDASFENDRQQLVQARRQQSQIETNQAPKKSRRMGTSVKGVRS